MKNKNLLFAVAFLFIANCTLTPFVFAQSNSTLWSTAPSGGSNGVGSIFKINPNGSGYSSSYGFNIINPGSAPYSTPCQASNGKLYGLTTSGGAYSGGVLFSYDPTSGIYSDLLDFDGSNGSSPNGSLIQASNGKLYGMTNGGGAYGAGLMFSFDPSSGTYTKELDFDGSNGAYPFGSLMQASDGKLYGMVSQGGANGYGLIFRFDPSTSTFTDVLDFDYTSGGYPQGDLTQASDGKLYGMTYYGGANGIGVLFSFDPSSSAYSDLLDFDGTNGANPQGSLMQASNGKLYGMTYSGGANGLGVLFSYNPATSAYADLLDFNGVSGGYFPYGNLTQASNGKLYGMTLYGGTSGNGVVFSFNLTGNVYSNLINFTGANGANAYGSLIQATNSKLYGLTSMGGTNDNGVLFSYDISGSSYSNLVNFNLNNGANPNGSLMQASNGKLYGMTNMGGNSNSGVLFSYVATTNTYSPLLDFNGTNGANPDGGLMQALSGSIYGMTKQGGSNDKGVLFSFNSSTDTYSKLLDFSGSANGSYPEGSLVQASNGKLYGMTREGGTSNRGVLFSFDPASSTYAKLYDFNTSNGTYPYGSLIAASNGKLYGVTSQGGAGGVGVLFSFDPSSSTFTKLRSFSSGDGASPYGTLIQATNGKLFGLTSAGGAYDGGVLFSYDLSSSAYFDLLDFDGSNGYTPSGSLKQGLNGTKLYGMTTSGGDYYTGVLFNFDINSLSYTKLRDLSSPDATAPLYSGFTQLTPITTGSIASTLCPGAKVNVPSTVVSGSFSPGNVFTAQLSDANGGFASPVNIGTRTATAQGTIVATIPSSTIAGTGYRIRVIGSNIAVNGSDNGSDITVYPLPTGSATSFLTPICSGMRDSIVLHGDLPGTTFTWPMPAAAITGTQAACPSGCATTIYDSLYNKGTVNRTLTYTITPRANGCAGTTFTGIVTVRPVPIAKTNAYANPVCGGTNTNIALSASTGPTNFSWTAPTVTDPVGGGAILNATSGSASSITQKLVNTGNSNGYVTYTVTPSYLGCPGLPIVVTDTVKPGPFVGTASPSPAAICTARRDSITLDGLYPGISFTWTCTIADSITGTAAACTSNCGTLIYDSLYNGGTNNKNVTYNITPRLNGCAGKVFKEIVTVRPIPKAFATDKTICSNAKTSLIIRGSISGTIFATTSSLTTSPNDGTIIGFGPSNASTINQTLSSNGYTKGIVTYTINPSYKGCPGPAIQTNISVNPPPTGHASPSPAGVCSNSAANITLIPGIPTKAPVAGTHFTWTSKLLSTIFGAGSCADTSGGCGTHITDSPTNISTTVGPIETYTITPYANGCGGTKFSTNLIVQGGMPATPNILGQKNGVCSSPETYTYYVSNLAAFNSLTWQLPQGCSFVGGTNLHDNPITISYPSWYIMPYAPSTTHDSTRLKAIATNLCGTNSNSQVFIPTPAIAFPITGNKSGLCGSTGKLFSVPSYPGHSYYWSISSGSGITMEDGGSTTNTMTADFSPEFTSGIISCTISGCGTDQSFNYSLTGACLAPTSLTGNVSHCGNSGPYTYKAAASVGAVSYVWTLPPGGSAASLTTTVPSINVTYAGSSTGNITVKAVNNCGQQSSAKSLTVFLIPSCRTQGIPDESGSYNMTAYPNPAYDRINIEFISNNTNEYLIKLIDVTGRTVMKQVNNAQEGRNILELKVASYAKGIYMIILANEDGERKERVVIE